MALPNNILEYILSHPFYGDRTVTPLGESTFKMKWDLINDDTQSALYDYNITFDGTLILFAEDYHWIKVIEDDVANRGSDLLVKLKLTGTELLPGTLIKLNDATFDMDRCTVTIPVSRPDIYQTFHDAISDTLNMFHVPGAGAYGVNMFDESPVYEYNATAIEHDGFPLSAQLFEHYPNARAQYPGFGCEGEIADPYWPESSSKIFDNLDLTTLTREPTSTFEEYLTTGSIPYHNGTVVGTAGVPYPYLATYAGAFTAVNEGWRLYYFRYKAQSNGSSMNMIALWRWVRQIKDVAIGTIMGPEWFYVGVVGGMDRWAKAPTLMPRTNSYKPSFVTIDFPSEHQVWFEYTTFIPGIATALVSAFDLSLNTYGFQRLENAVRLNDLIEFAVNYCDPSLTVKSDFFQINPFTVSGTNYATGLDSFTNEILIYQKSDIKRAWAPDKATIGEFTTDELFMWLRDMFNIRYRIDGSHFVIEWVDGAYFQHAYDINLTLAQYEKWINHKRTYNYDGGVKLPAKEMYSFMEQRPQVSFLPDDDFAGVPIYYDGNTVDRTKAGGTYTHTVGRITTDVIFIIEHGGGVGYLIDNTTSNPYAVQSSTDDGVISDDGFCMIATRISGGSRYGFIYSPVIDSIGRFNNVLGWCILHQSFHRSFRNSPTGTMNGSPITFTSTKYIKQLIPLSFGYTDILYFDPFAQVFTDLGMGIVKSAEYEIFDYKLTLVIGFR